MNFISPTPSRGGPPPADAGAGPALGAGSPGGSSAAGPLDLDAAISLAEAACASLQRDGVNAVEALPATMTVLLSAKSTASLDLPPADGGAANVPSLLAAWRDMLNRLKRHKALLCAADDAPRPAAKTIALSAEEKLLMEAITLALEPRGKP